MKRPPSTPGMLGWSRMSDPERLEAMTRWSMFIILVLSPWVVFIVVSESEDWQGWGAGALLGLSVVHAVVGAMTLAMSLDAQLGRKPLKPVWFAVLGFVTGAFLVIAFAKFPGTAQPEDLTIVVHAILAITLAAFAPVYSWRTLAVIALGAGVAWYGLANAVGVWDGTPFPGVLVTAIIVFFVSGSVRSSVWMINLFWEQERRRGVDARLAAAEERLSFSRDLHDTFGRTLSAVAVKSELAAELAARGREGAAEEMLEVRQIAEDALREMRELVAGMRAPDLTAELAGARSLLGSAGISVSTTLDDDELPRATQEALAWVVREAVTNVVRHSDATRCEIALRVEDVSDVRGPGPASSSASVVLEIVNDGARDAGTPGSGLVGLRERLGKVGGSLDATREGTTFRLCARVPLPGGTP